MLKIRVIPCLLLKDMGLVKTVNFDNPKYVGDPINAVKIFNEKEVDELIFLDIAATVNDKKPNFELLKRIASEAFMPFSYGGGIKTIEDIKKILEIGAEKVVVNAVANQNPKFIKEASLKFGSQSIAVGIDAKKEGSDYKVYINAGKVSIKREAAEYAAEMEKMGAGEIFLNSIDKDGTMEGYDLDLVKKVSQAVRIPIIASGGAREIKDFEKAVGAGASAVAAGSMFVFFGPYRAVLINYPAQEELKNLK